MERAGIPTPRPHRMRLAFSLLMLGVSPSAWSDLEAIQQKLAEPHALQGTFEQRHWLTHQETRLHSEGDFLYFRDQYIIWHYQTPMEATLTFQTAVMSVPRVTSANDGDSSKPDDGRGDTLKELLPGRIELERYLVALLGGNWQVLRGNFTIDMKGEMDDWEVMLTPSAPPLETYLSTITLSGGDYLEQLSFNAANGDELAISLIDVTPIIDNEVASFLVDWFDLTEDLIEESGSESNGDDEEAKVIAEEVDPEDTTLSDDDDDDEEDDD
ncbi:LolA family protein [Aidingimonas lacisalsi]|uniref:LolA family protein n=1 Tax=Aidingimonas lacisalsi TaxID=2604086 RepID=UPI0011D1835C|nr:outer membrane lipoprotein carrier protein LolA [Aidingimonas lacisalsi]